MNLNDANMRYMEANKELEIAWCNDLTWREMQISMSEDWAKKAFGEAIFGHLACRFFNEPSGMHMTAITDSGFRVEAEPVVRLVGAENCLLVCITRDGCDFSNDSRTYIDLTDLGVKRVGISNHYPAVEHYHTKVRMVLDAWLALPQR